MDSLACAEMVTRYGVSWLARNGVPYQSGVGTQLPKQNYVYYSAGSSVHIEHKDVDSDWSICLFLKQIAANIPGEFLVVFGSLLSHHLILLGINKKAETKVKEIEQSNK